MRTLCLPLALAVTVFLGGCGDAPAPVANGSADAPSAALKTALDEGRAIQVRDVLKEHPGLLAVEVAEGLPPLHYAVRAGRTDVVKAVIDAGADVVAPAPGTGLPPVFLVFEEEVPRQQVLDVLMRHGATVKVPSPVDGRTVLMAAAANARTPRLLVDRLLYMGSALDAADARGWTALHYAVKSGHADAVKAFLARDASIEAEAEDAGTPLDLARAAAESNAEAAAILTLLEAEAEAE